MIGQVQELLSVLRTRERVEPWLRLETQARGVILGIFVGRWVSASDRWWPFGVAILVTFSTAAYAAYRAHREARHDPESA